MFIRTFIFLVALSFSVFLGASEGQIGLSEDQLSLWNSIQDQNKQQAVDQNGNTRLHRAIIACENESALQMAQILDEATKLMDVQNNDGYTPLHLIIRQIVGDNQPNSFAVFKALVKKKFNVNARTKKDFATSLHLAIEADLPPIISILLENGADKDAQNKSGHTPLHTAVFNNRHQLIPLLLTKQNKNLTDNNGRTALYIAAGKGHTNCLLKLIEARADVNIPDVFCDTALHYVAAYGPVDAIQILLDASANITLKNEKGDTALELAKLYNQEAVDIMEKQKVKKLSEDLQRVIQNKDSNKVKEEKIRDLLAQSAQPQGAFVSLAEQENLRLMKLFAKSVTAQDVQQAKEVIDQKQRDLTELYNQEQDKTKKNNLKNNLANITEIQKFIVSLLQAPVLAEASPVAPGFAQGYAGHGKAMADTSSGKQVAQVPSAAAESSAPKDKDILQLNKKLLRVLSDETKKEQYVLQEVQELVASGAQVNTRDHDKQTPLHLASYRGFGKVVEFLLQKCADTRLQNFMYDTALHVACSQGLPNESFEKLLLASQAFLEVKNNEDRTPLLALICGNRINLDKFKLMVEQYKADITVLVEEQNLLGVLEDKIDILEIDSDQTAAVKKETDETYKVQEYIISKFKEMRSHFNIPLLNKKLFDTLYNRSLTEQQIGNRVKMLLLQGAQVGAICDDKELDDDLSSTPLHVAAAKHYESVVILLITNGADVNTLNAYRVNPLMAIFFNDEKDPSLEFIRLMVEKYQSRLDCVSSANGLDILSLIQKRKDTLVSEHANRNRIKLFNKIDAYFRSLPYFKNKVAKMALAAVNILSKAPIAQIQKSIDQAKAASSSNSEMDDLLLQSAKEGNLALLRYAIQYGANINARSKCDEDEESLSPLEWGVSRNHIDIVTEILKYIDKLNVIGEYGRNALHLAVIHASLQEDYNFEIIRALFNAGLDVNVITSDDGKTAFFDAAIRGLPDIVILLLPKADLSVKNKKRDDIVTALNKVIAIHKAQLTAGKGDVANIAFLKKQMANRLKVLMLINKFKGSKSDTPQEKVLLRQGYEGQASAAVGKFDPKTGYKNILDLICKYE